MVHVLDVRITRHLLVERVRSLHRHITQQFQSFGLRPRPRSSSSASAVNPPIQSLPYCPCWVQLSSAGGAHALTRPMRRWINLVCCVSVCVCVCVWVCVCVCVCVCVFATCMSSIMQHACPNDVDMLCFATCMLDMLCLQHSCLKLCNMHVNYATCISE